MPLSSVPIPFVVETFITGELHFKKVFSPQGPPFSAVNYIHAFVDYFAYFYNIWFSLLYLSIIWGIFLQLAISYQVLTDDLRGLRNQRVVNEKEQLESFKVFVNDGHKLKQ